MYQAGSASRDALEEWLGTLFPGITAVGNSVIAHMDVLSVPGNRVPGDSPAIIRCRRQGAKDARQTPIRELEKMPRPSIMMPFREITARKSTGASTAESVTGSSKYISLTTRM